MGAREACCATKPGPEALGEAADSAAARCSKGWGCRGGVPVACCRPARTSSRWMGDRTKLAAGLKVTCALTALSQGPQACVLLLPVKCSLPLLQTVRAEIDRLAEPAGTNTGMVLAG